MASRAGGRERRVVRRSSFVTLLAGTLVLAACGQDAGTGSDGRLTVLAAFYPLAEAAERVGGPAVDVVNLTPPGVEPHDLELAPDDLETIVTADVVLLVGGGFQPAVEDAAADAQGRVVDVLDGIETLPPPEDEHAGEEHAQEEGLSADPHVWLDPVVFGQIVERVAEELAEASPDDAGAFRAGSDTYVAELEDLDTEFRSDLERCETRTMVVSHAAFGYLADAYALEQHAISGISPEAEPDAQRLAELVDLVRAEGITTIFTEKLVSPDVAETLAEEAGARTAVLDPLEGLTQERLDAGEDYVSVMRENLDVLRDALGCT
jgi:zinc transport system substrate-binding protein